MGRLVQLNLFQINILANGFVSETNVYPIAKGG